MTTPFDPGLQPERTRLAWRRTLLSLGVGCVVALRVLPPVLGAWVVPVCVVGVVAAAVMAVLARRRSRDVGDALATGTPVPGAGLLAALATCAALGAAVAGTTLVLR